MGHYFLDTRYIRYCYFNIMGKKFSIWFGYWRLDTRRARWYSSTVCPRSSVNEEERRFGLGACSQEEVFISLEALSFADVCRFVLTGAPRGLGSV